MMRREMCSPANSLLEADLVLAAQYGIIDKLKAAETPIGYYVTVQFADKDQLLKRSKGVGLMLPPEKKRGESPCYGTAM